MISSSSVENAILVLVTAASETEAKAIAFALLEQKLAACINCFPVQSIYRWQGKIQEDAEWQILIKTRSDVFESLESAIKSMHSYDLPEIIAIPIQQGSLNYLTWMSQEISPK